MSDKEKIEELTMALLSTNCALIILKNDVTKLDQKVMDRVINGWIAENKQAIEKTKQ